MIRNVVLGRIREVADPAQAAEDRAAVQAALEGIDGLDLPGKVASHVGWDEGLRPGGWSFAITSDWVDAIAYRAYDMDAEHNRYRAQVVDLCTDVARVQFAIDSCVADPVDTL